MKKTKWTKWKIGAGTAVLLFCLFQYVKATPEFTAAQQVAVASTTSITKPQQSLAAPLDSETDTLQSGRRSRRNSSLPDGRQFSSNGNGSSSSDSGTGTSSSSSGSRDNSSGNGSGSSGFSSSGTRSHTQSRAS